MIASAGGLFVAGNKIESISTAATAAVPPATDGDKPKLNFGVSFDSAWRLDQYQSLENTPQNACRALPKAPCARTFGSTCG